ncbi:MAG: peptide-methionine (S)-S-oxide reductase, partial [Candidatus Cybelea sp.]
MKIRTAIALFLALGIGAATAPAVATADMTPAGSERVVLAGGCFWGMQLVFEELKGVDRVVAGYAGGNANT